MKDKDKPQEDQQLPPRSEVHRGKKKKTNLKIKYPIIRLLVIFFVLLPISVLSVIYYNNLDKSSTDSTLSSRVNNNFEALHYATANPTNDKETAEVNEDHDTTEELNTEDSDTSIKNEKVQVNEVEGSINEGEESITNSSDIDKTTKEESKPTQQQYELKYHKVKAKETLYSVSMKYYQSREGEEVIKQWNKLNSNQIYEGQVLIIPIKLPETK